MNLRRVLLAAAVMLSLCSSTAFAQKKGGTTPPPPPPPPFKYTLTITDSGVVATNEYGRSVGYNDALEPYIGSATNPTDRVYIRDFADGTWTFMNVRDLNNSDQAAGWGRKVIDGVEVQVGYRLSLPPADAPLDALPVFEVFYPNAVGSEVHVWADSMADDGRVVAVSLTPGATNHDVILLEGSVGAGAKRTIMPAASAGYKVGMNEAGVVVGDTIVSGERKGFRYTPGGSFETFGPLATWKRQVSEKSSANGINELGDCTGRAAAKLSGSTTIYNATVWKSGTTTATDLGAINANGAEGMFLNSNGVVVGKATNSLGNPDSWVLMQGKLYWLRDVCDTPLPDGVSYLEVRDINEWGQISGFVRYFSPQTGNDYDGFIMTPPTP